MTPVAVAWAFVLLLEAFGGVDVTFQVGAEATCEALLADTLPKLKNHRYETPGCRAYPASWAAALPHFFASFDYGGAPVRVTVQARTLDGCRQARRAFDRLAERFAESQGRPPAGLAASACQRSDR